MKRKIIKINEEKCNGCGECVTACHESAIIMVNGKAKLISDEYCDGLGDCLNCPVGAIELIEREAVEYDEEAVQRRKAEIGKLDNANIKSKGCPGSREMQFDRSENKVEAVKPKLGGCPGSREIKFDRSDMKSKVAEKMNNISREETQSELRQWPVQLSLVSSNAGYLEGADILIAADCVPFAYPNFHSDILAGKILLVGCPKLDDVASYKEKLMNIITDNDIKSITVARMEVPCCAGITRVAKEAMLDSKKIVPYSEIVISVDGKKL